MKDGRKQTAEKMIKGKRRVKKRCTIAKRMVYKNVA